MLRLHQRVERVERGIVDGAILVAEHLIEAAEEPDRGGSCVVVDDGDVVRVFVLLPDVPAADPVVCAGSWRSLRGCPIGTIAKLPAPGRVELDAVKPAARVELPLDQRLTSLLGRVEVEPVVRGRIGIEKRLAYRRGARWLDPDRLRA